MLDDADAFEMLGDLPDREAREKMDVTTSLQLRFSLYIFFKIESSCCKELRNWLKKLKVSGTGVKDLTAVFFGFPST